MTAAFPAAGPLLVGRYVLHGKIASGGMATVYFGRMAGAAGFARTVAIKRLHPHLAEEPDFVSMMIDEARLAARVQHPHVAQTFDVVSAGGELLIVMEYVVGESLARLLRAERARERLVPVPIVVAIMNGVLRGLHAAHEAKNDRGVPLGIVHRDVSPQNVLVGVDGHARVIDFGVAKAAGRLQTTREGVVKGKLAYMAPEQLGGQATTRLADIYAAGVVLWEALTGRRLFKADDDVALFSQVLAGPTEPPSRRVAGLPEVLDALVMRSLARDPAARFATAREMADALVRASPPALAAEVGAWVEEVAKPVLDDRAKHVADIESESSSVPPPGAEPPDAATTVAPATRARRSASSTPDAALVGDDELPTNASQPSSISVETPPRSLLLRAQRASRGKAWLGAGVAVAIAVGIAATLAWRGSTSSDVSSAPAPNEAPSAAAASPVPLEAASTPAAPAPSSSARAAATSTSQGARAEGVAPKPARSTAPQSAPGARSAKPVPKPAGSVVFVTPD